MTGRTIGQVERELRRSRDAMDSSTLSGRSRTADLQVELTRMREAEAITPARWPESKHLPPLALPVGTVVNGRAMRFPVRVLSEDEYQLLLAGFKAAGGAIEGTTR